jgi:hypothetical protein
LFWISLGYVMKIFKICICFLICLSACGRARQAFYGRTQITDGPGPEIESADGVTETGESTPIPTAAVAAAVHPEDGAVIPVDDIYYDEDEIPPTLSDERIFQLRALTSISPDRQLAFRNAASHTVKVLQMNYFPLRADGSIDFEETASPEDWTLESLRARVAEFSVKTAAGLSQSTKGVGQNTAYLNYQVVDTKEFLKKIAVKKSGATSAYFPDHQVVLQQDVSICDYVDRLGVRDVWIFMYHRGEAVVPIESNMSMGTISSQYFNYQGFGDISNSYRENDLPQCVNTYVVYQFNYNRGSAENLHNYGHQRESMYRHLNYEIWELEFVQPYGGFSSSERVINHCGKVHYPPNAAHAYDYDNETATLTHCNFWLRDAADPFQYESHSCSSWNCDHYQWLIWWGQRMPGFGTSLKFNTRPLRNFHEFFADFDVAMAQGASLYDMQAVEAANEGKDLRTVYCPEGLAAKCEVLVPLGKQVTGPCGFVSESKDGSDRNRQLLPNQTSLSLCVEIQSRQIDELLPFYSDRNFYVEYYDERVLKLSME